MVYVVFPFRTSLFAASYTFVLTTLEKKTNSLNMPFFFLTSATVRLQQVTLLLRCRRLLWSYYRDYLSLYDFPILLMRKAFRCSFEFESQIFFYCLIYGRKQLKSGTSFPASTVARDSDRDAKIKRLSPLSCSGFRTCDV